jgi:hypothetical protein
MAMLATAAPAVACSNDVKAKIFHGFDVLQAVDGRLCGSRSARIDELAGHYLDIPIDEGANTSR